IWKTDQALMARRLDWLMDFDIHDSLAEIDLPTTLITGGCDVVVPPACQEKLANTMPDCDMRLIKGAGHLGFLTHTNEFLDYIAQAMSQQDFVAIG
ncbi:MAG: alpha/beta fold hydrolase, partial [bacterium]